jgi:DNA-binding transcriptional LysR family regulator
VEIVLQERNTDEVIRACLDDRADLGIAVLAAESVPASVDSWHFADDPLVVVMPLRHALAKRKILRFSEVVDHPLVGVRRGGSLDLLLQDQAAARHHSLKTSIFVGATDAACRMVEAGFGLAVLPSGAASVYAGTRRIDRRPLDEPWATRELRLLAPKKKARLRAVEAAIETLRR